MAGALLVQPTATLSLAVGSQSPAQLALLRQHLAAGLAAQEKEQGPPPDSSASTDLRAATHAVCVVAGTSAGSMPFELLCALFYCTVRVSDQACLDENCTC